MSSAFANIWRWYIHGDSDHNALVKPRLVKGLCELLLAICLMAMTAFLVSHFLPVPRNTWRSYKIVFLNPFFYAILVAVHCQRVIVRFMAWKLISGSYPCRTGSSREVILAYRSAFGPGDDISRLLNKVGVWIIVFSVLAVGTMWHFYPHVATNSG